MQCFALTGNIATGKSTLSKMLKSAGVPVIDADQLAREVVKPGSQGLGQIVGAFGPKYLEPNGTLKRQELAKLVFSDIGSRKKLESITHPLIAKALQKRLEQLRKKEIKAVVYEAPLIFETHIEKGFDATILVFCNEDLQVKRLMSRDGFTKEEAQKRISSQMPQLEKQKLAQASIDNSGSLEESEKQLRQVWHLLTGSDLSSCR